MLLTRSRACALSGVAALALAGAVVATAPGATAATHNGASTAHPYSNPVWYPLRAASTLDCAGTNPSPPRVKSCAGEHNADHKVDWITGTPQDRKSVAVYAAGAGIVHVGDIASRSCVRTRTAANSRGTWLWIDHGGGVVSIYMHLAATSAKQLSVRSGDYVTPRTRLGMSGDTGNACGTHLIHYLDFQIKHNAIWKGHGNLTGKPAAINTLRACYQGKRVNWPADLPGKHYASWHRTPKLTLIPTSSSTCVPQRAPRTPGAPSGVGVRPGSDSLSVHWYSATHRRNPDVTHIRVELWEYHASIHRYTAEPARMVSSRATSVRYSGLHQRCRARVAFYGGEGWSHWSGWHYATPK